MCEALWGAAGVCGLVAFAVGSRQLGLWAGGFQLVVLEGLPHSPRGGRADVLVDRECLLQVRGGLAGVAFLEVGVADSFQGACLLWGRADVAGDGQRPGVLVMGLAATSSNVAGHPPAAPTRRYSRFHTA